MTKINYCSTCCNSEADAELVSYYTNHKGKRAFQCKDCMEGSNCFTCECCGDGLATECVDYKPSGYREWWCLDCAIDHDKTVFSKKNSWYYEQPENLTED